MPLACLSLLFACGDAEPTLQANPPELGGLQSLCGPEEPCEAWLLCLDGVCRDHSWPGPAGELQPDVIARPDIHGYLGDTASEGDGTEADAAVFEDGGVTDAQVQADGLDAKPKPELPPKDPDASVPQTDTEDAQPPEDLPPAEDSEITEDVSTGEETEDNDSAADAQSEDQDVGPEPASVILYVSVDSAATDPGSQFLALAEGQAWVADLTLPKSGAVIAMDVMADNVFSPGSCGRFRPAFWQMDADGVWAEEPSWQSPEVQPVQGKSGSQTFLLAESPEFPEGEIRAGLIYEQPCDGEPPMPWLFTDASGELGGTWLWS
ncbi:MAG: hypothetical protein VX938_11675, partial [Myxococcota bacterium]|nr:hypothetical protein [Myxococcota bacterium]